MCKDFYKSEISADKKINNIDRIKNCTYKDNISHYEQGEEFSYNYYAKKRLSLYKTEMCRSYEESNQCKYGDRCQFAHNKSELRNIARHPRYKTEICKTFWDIGTCPYGKRCCFIHTKENQINVSETKEIDTVNVDIFAKNNVNHMKTNDDIIYNKIMETDLYVDKNECINKQLNILSQDSEDNIFKLKKPMVQNDKENIEKTNLMQKNQHLDIVKPTKMVVTSLSIQNQIKKCNNAIIKPKVNIIELNDKASRQCFEKTLAQKSNENKILYEIALKEKILSVDFAEITDNNETYFYRIIFKKIRIYYT